METSLIISTYNWPAALEVVIKSVLRQSQLPGEVLIADDGSGAETKELVERYQIQFPVPLKHIWHEDQGFRLAEIRNKAIAEAGGEYIIQIDGDTFLHTDFIRDHVSQAQKNCFVTGSRVLLGKEFSEKILAQRQPPALSVFSSDLGNRLNALRLPVLNAFSQPKNAPLEKMTTRIRGCNMAFWREDLLAVNGYDEEFIGWGREDSDIVIRLIKKGLFRKKIKFAAIQYHLWHLESPKDKVAHNHQLMEKKMMEGTFIAKKGIRK